MGLSKACYCMPYSLLIAKLEACGFKRNALTLVCSYLANRTQRVKVGSAYSSPKCVSVLGPMFNVNNKYVTLLTIRLYTHATPLSKQS